MDKWKDIELEKMKAGGNGKFRLFLEVQDDYDPTWTLQEKYNSKAAALFRDKVRCADLHFHTDSTFRTKFHHLIKGVNAFYWFVGRNPCL